MFNQTAYLVRAEVQEVRFGLFAEEEVRDMSVCRIVSPVTFDTLGNSIRGGLYDSRMGPRDQQANACETCSLIYMNCPGHCGHIELSVPVYHPLHFKALYQLLQAKCASCHKFRLPDAYLRRQLLVLKLLEMGDVERARGLQGAPAKGSADSLVEESDSKEVELDVRRLEAKYALFRKRSALPGPHVKQQQSEVIAALMKACTAVVKCASCGTTSPKLRKDGYSKIYQRALTGKQSAELKSRRVKLKSGLEAIDEEKEAEAEDDSDSDASAQGEEEKGKRAASRGDKYLAPLEVEAQLRLLWARHTELLEFIWSRAVAGPVNESWRLFFVKTVLVPPSRFRPPSTLGSSVAEHPQNVALSAILTSNENIEKARLGKPKAEGDVEGENSGVDMTVLMTHWMALQNAVISFIDSDKDNSKKMGSTVSGIRQLLERKEGLFRRHMMGKRVNYCCRSVISPDPYIGTNEIGIPVKFASSLHIPTPVTSWNVKFLRELVERGPNSYPGANHIETADGRVVNLARLNDQERVAKGKLLLASPGTKVYRHLMNGDPLLVNRQPTLHKPGIMAHRARVLEHVPEQTLRMNYPNCNAYNADFDGDEINCHFVQNQIARAEANYIMNTDNQYIVPTSGNPLRGLIQDHVASAVKLTARNTFLTRVEFQQLLYVAVSGLPGTEVVAHSEDMVMPMPAVLRPRELWTGKQVISALLSHLCRPPMPPLHLDGKARTPASAMGAEQNEHIVVFRYGELLSGVLDKAAIGNSTLGVVHAVYELYGADLAGRLLSAFGRLFTYHLQDAGQSCGVQDLVLTASADAERRRLLSKVRVEADHGLLSFLTTGSAASDGPRRVEGDEVTAKEKLLCEGLVAEEVASDRLGAKVRLDAVMQGVINKVASEVIKACLPGGLQAPFLKNNFSMMVLTGAKGSAVNQSQISCFLGQQALEGQRVPVMISGKTLPSFRAYDASARAGGFVQDRFLTGVKPQEYYFHCMAGREGLVDTAVKTSRSGYLQRCLVKHLEELKVDYDMTVRDSGGNVIQFVYGEDGLDPMSSNLLDGASDKMLFLARNYMSLVHKYSINENFISQGFDMDLAERHRSMMNSAVSLLNRGGKSVKEGDVVLARRRRSADVSWLRSNLERSWSFAEVTRVRKGDEHTYDLKYVADGEVEKKVPLSVAVTGQTGVGGVPMGITSHALRNVLIKPYLPDPAMSVLPLGTAIGACSERMQSAIDGYVAKNPDGILSEDPSPTTVAKDAFEFLVWVKYMRSLACPGEAVGCVAAQSVGEPSTQMTLNTFHLAGHGGANVTLGIPRLREIIMTASKNAKTPTMLIPLVKGETMAAAKTLARSLSRLSLSDLLSHKGGVLVRETFCKSGSEWMRRYAVRVQFENPARIKEMFGVSFKEILVFVKNDLVKRMNVLVKRDLKHKGAVDFLSKGGDVIAKGKGEGEGGEEEEGEGRAKDGNVLDTLLDGEEEVEEGDSDDEKGEQDVAGYDDDAPDAAADDAPAKAAVTEDSDSDSDGEEVKVDTKKSAAKSASPMSGTKPQRLARSSAKTISASDEVAHSEKEGWAEIEIMLPASSRRLLLVQIAEAATAHVAIRSTKGIKNAYALQSDVNGEDRVAVQTEGVNFEAIWDLKDAVDVSEIKSNDIYTILQTFGVEAARSSIVAEIVGVFGVYGINVNLRHLNLIADFMTRGGTYVPMNRKGMEKCESPFLQMSFETTCTFLTQAAQQGMADEMESPSARIVLGKVAKLGTGAFELLVPVP